MIHIKKISSKEIYTDQKTKGFVELWDFSKANTSAVARIEAITKVASVCYNSPLIQNSLRVFNMLEAESLGLPSTSFEYVPVLIPYELLEEIRNEVKDKFKKEPFTLNMERFGEFVVNDTVNHIEESDWYLLTNLRAVLYDDRKYHFECVDFKSYFNTSEDEIDIIVQNFKTFLFKTPIFVARQLVRHRLQFLQELSRRYTNENTAPIEFYAKNNNLLIKLFNSSSLVVYKILRKFFKMKAEDARGVLGTNMYTTLWSGWLNLGYDNFINLRDTKKAQSEIRELAVTCNELWRNR